MKKFSCCYLDSRGEYPIKKIEAASAEEAAHIYAEQYPSEDPLIHVAWFPIGYKYVDNPGVVVAREKATAARAQQEEVAAAARAQQEEAAAAATAARVEREEAATAARIKSLQEFLSIVENASGNLGDLSYHYLSALIENMRDFPDIRDELSPEECALRERLYKVAFFDRNLQARLQTEQAELQTKQAELQVELLRDLKSAFTGLQSGKSGSGAGKSNLARNAAMIGGIAALQKLNQIEENTGDVSEGLGFD